MKRRIVGLIMSFLAGGALAQTGEPQKPAAAFGADKPDCLEWTDGCIICKKREDGAPACSTVGAACLPAEPICTKLRRDGGG